MKKGSSCSTFKGPPLWRLQPRTLPPCTTVWSHTDVSSLRTRTVRISDLGRSSRLSQFDSMNLKFSFTRGFILHTVRVYDIAHGSSYTACGVQIVEPTMVYIRLGKAGVHRMIVKWADLPDREKDGRFSVHRGVAVYGKDILHRRQRQVRCISPSQHPKPRAHMRILYGSRRPPFMHGIAWDATLLGRPVRRGSMRWLAFPKSPACSRRCCVYSQGFFFLAWFLFCTKPISRSVP